MLESLKQFRFVLSCNDSTKIIDAIQSRCAILRFTKLTDKQILARLLEVIDKETVRWNKILRTNMSFRFNTKMMD